MKRAKRERYVPVPRETVERMAGILGDYSAAARALRDADEYLSSEPAGSVMFARDFKTSHLVVVKSRNQEPAP